MTESVSSDFVRQVRMALEVLAGQTALSPTDEISALLGLGGGGVYSFMFALAKNFGASVFVSAGDHIRFDTIDAESPGQEITVTTGGGDLTDGLITLPIGHVFLCRGWIEVNAITGADFLRSSWRNNTDAVLFGGENEQTGDTGSTDSTSLDTCFGIIDTSAEAKEIELRNTARSAGGVTYTGRSFALITEL